MTEDYMVIARIEKCDNMIVMMMITMRMIMIGSKITLTDDGDADGELANLKLSNCEIASWVTEDYTDIASNCRQLYTPAPLVQLQHH